MATAAHQPLWRKLGLILRLLLPPGPTATSIMSPSEPARRIIRRIPDNQISAASLAPPASLPHHTTNPSELG